MFIYNTTTMSNIYSFISMFDDDLSTNKKIQKTNIILEGSMHPPPPPPSPVFRYAQIGRGK